MKLKNTTVEYQRIGTGKDSFSFSHGPVPTLPSGNSNQEIFRRVIAESQDDTLRQTLSDLYRYLVFSNFAKFGEPRDGERGLTLQELDVTYPYRGALREAENPNAAYHPSGKTDIRGGILYLLMHSENREDTNHILGAILMSVLRHRKFNRRGLPTIEAPD